MIKTLQFDEKIAIFELWRMRHFSVFSTTVFVCALDLLFFALGNACLSKTWQKMDDDGKK